MRKIVSLGTPLKSAAWILDTTDTSFDQGREENRDSVVCARGTWNYRIIPVAGIGVVVNIRHALKPRKPLHESYRKS
jgi:hypothetical protein